MKAILIIISVLAVTSGFSQVKTDKAEFKEYEPGYYQNSILKDVRFVNESMEDKKVHKHFQMVQTEYDLQNKVSNYKKEWTNPVISQGNAGTCCAYSTISFLP